MTSQLRLRASDYPDLPEVGVVGKSQDEAERLIRKGDHARRGSRRLTDRRRGSHNAPYASSARKLLHGCTNDDGANWYRTGG
jgi:hypothetical protein